MDAPRHHVNGGEELATTIRLTRMGKKKRPFYRLVVLDSRKRRDGAYLANLGYYNPFVEPLEVELHEDEVILGAKRDEAFGATMMFGLGGLFVETFRDVTFALAPITPEAAGRMVRGVKAWKVLDGARGAKRADIEGIEDSLLRLSQLVTDFERIVELDVNPLIVGAGANACAVADVRIRLS